MDEDVHALVSSATPEPSRPRVARVDLPDPAVLDVSMPGRSGLEVCAELRADATVSHARKPTARQPA